MKLPSELQAAMARELRSLTRGQLAVATAKLSWRYRQVGAGEQGTSSYSGDDVAAYLAYRLPGTYAAVGHVFEATSQQMPGWTPKSLLDIGAGPGTVSFAASEAWPEIETIRCCERDERMIEAGRHLTGASSVGAVQRADWRQTDVLESFQSVATELVVASYVLGEVSPARRNGLVEQLWRLATSLLVIVEPGTPAGFAIIRAARSQLLESGAWVVAPCPHDEVCPMPTEDWCHFVQRLERRPAHRRAKHAELGFEDEKFSYVVLSKTIRSRAGARILRHPQTRRGHIKMELCTPNGLREATVSRRHSTAFRQARHAAWGDCWEEPSD